MDQMKHIEDLTSKESTEIAVLAFGFEVTSSIEVKYVDQDCYGDGDFVLVRFQHPLFLCNECECNVHIHPSLDVAVSYKNAHAATMSKLPTRNQHKTQIMFLHKRIRPRAIKPPVKVKK
jgi:hypothetical protein